MVSRLRTRRIIVAAAGYGKTTTLRRWFPADASRWCRGARTQPRRFVIDAVAAGERQLVLDDLPPLTDEAVRALVETVSALPDTVTVALSSRWPLAARCPSPGQWTEFGPADLALTTEQVDDLILAEYGLTGPGLAQRVYDTTGGWPALVHLTAETLRLYGVPHGPLAPAVAEPGSPLSTHVTDEVLATLPDDAIRMLRHIGELSPVTSGLCVALGHQNAPELVALLRRTGVLTRAEASMPGLPTSHERVVGVVAEVLRHGSGPTSTSTRRGTPPGSGDWQPSCADASRWRHGDGRAPNPTPVATINARPRSPRDLLPSSPSEAATSRQLCAVG